MLLKHMRECIDCNCHNQGKKLYIFKKNEGIRLRRFPLEKSFEI